MARRASRLRRIRRPLLALLVLLAAFGIGYGVRAARSDTPPRPPSVSTTTPPVTHT